MLYYTKESLFVNLNVNAFSVLFHILTIMLKYEPRQIVAIDFLLPLIDGLQKLIVL